MLCFQPTDSFPHQVPEPLFFSSFGFSIILEVATPPQQEVSRCFRFSTLDACPSGFSEVPSRIQPLPATPSTGLPPSLLPSWASQITSQVVNSLHQSSHRDCLGEKLCVSEGATSWLETGLEMVSSNRWESGHHIKKKLPCGCSFGVVVETVTVPNELHLQRPILLCGLLPLRLWSGL